jgi:hypothetical protein
MKYSFFATKMATTFLNNESMLTELQKMNNVFNTKDSFGLHPVFKSTDPVYTLPQPISLPSGRKYRAALIDFSSDNYFENINPDLKNDKFFYSTDKGVTFKEIKIARGYYDIDEYVEEINRQMILNGDYDKKESADSHNKSYIKFDISLSTYKTIITITNENYVIDFSKKGTFRENLGYEKIKLSGSKQTVRHISSKRIQITHIKRINFHCDVITGGYDNQGKKSDILFSYPTGEFEPGRVIALRPNVPLYLPVVRDVLDVINCKLTDQNGIELKSEGEEFSCCLWFEQV